MEIQRNGADFSAMPNVSKIGEISNRILFRVAFPTAAARNPMMRDPVSLAL